jgi:ADP-ribose pyrophosphatase YjhB (NUDIX family)
MADPDDIERLLGYLRDTYGEFPVESGTYQHSEEGFERVLANHERGVPGAARVWVEREGETLLVRTHGGPDGWGVPGGFIEPDEHSDRAGEREVHEETGIECEVFDVAYVHIAENRLEDGDCEPIEELGVAFLARYTGGSLDRQAEEIEAVRWWSEVPENAYPPASRLGPERL